MARKRVELTVLNLQSATFECTYGRGCEGICCQNGRPPVSSEESARIEKNLKKFWPHLTSQAKELIQRQGFLSRRIKSGKPMLRVVGGWCVFFNDGCVLHKVGAAEGDKFKYKPAPCSLFPLERDDATGHLYVRQHGYKGEQWDLFCLAPDNTSVKAAESLVEELAFAQRQAS
ncbi:MAG: DUF3109 family protein [Gemmataceae bacterium]